MVQEHKVINTFSGIQFVEEGEPVDNKPQCETCAKYDADRKSLARDVQFYYDKWQEAERRAAQG